MKINLIFLLIVIVGSCNSKSLPLKLIPDEYYFPDGEIEFGKTFIYLNSTSGDTTYLDLFHSKINGETFLIQCSHDKNSVSDSLIFLNRRLVDYYINPINKGKLWKANRISDSVITDEEGKLSEVSEFNWKKDTVYAFVKSKSQIVKDTVLQWDGKSHPGIITNTVIETSSNFLRTPDGKFSFKMELVNYICKDIGSVRRLLVCSWNSNQIISNLIAIKNR